MRPDLPSRRQRGEHATHGVLASDGCALHGVLELRHGRDDPRYLRECARGRVRQEVGERGLDPFRLERRVRPVLREEEECVVAVREGAAGIRVDLPRDAARLELLGHGGPAEPRGLLRRGSEERTPRAAVGVDRRGHGVRAVRIGRPQRGAEIHVADREGAREREVVGDVAPVEVAHRHRGIVAVEEAVRGHPGARHEHALVLRTPEVDRVGRASATGPPRGDMERVDGAPLSVGLAQHTARRTVAKAADSAVPPEVVIEGAVLLDHDHDALDIAEPRGARPPGERIEGEARADGKARGEELAAGESGVTHGPAYSTGCRSSARWPPASPTAPTTGHPSDVRGAELPGPTG